MQIYGKFYANFDYLHANSNVKICNYAHFAQFKKVTKILDMLVKYTTGGTRDSGGTHHRAISACHPTDI